MPLPGTFFLKKMIYKIVLGEGERAKNNGRKRLFDHLDFAVSRDDPEQNVTIPDEVVLL